MHDKLHVTCTMSCIDSETQEEQYYFNKDND